MPLKLSTTIGKVQNIPNSKNIEIVNEFLEYMRNNSSSEHHQNNNLKVVLTFGNFIGNDNSFLDINKKEQILEFVNTKIKSYDEDPDKRWITTWNNYLNRLRLFYRWLYNHDNDIDHENWETPEFVRIKNKKSKRISPYLESEILEEKLLRPLAINPVYRYNIIIEKNAISFLIDMNKLFEKFVVNILRETLPQIDHKYEIQEQKKEYADIQKQLELKLDILINYNNNPSIILDTKYMEFESKPNSSHLAQMNLYSDVKKVKNCGLIFPGTNSNKIYQLDKIGLNLHILFFDIKADTHYEFKNKCNLFINSLTDIFNSFNNPKIQ